MSTFFCVADAMDLQGLAMSHFSWQRVVHVQHGRSSTLDVVLQTALEAVRKKTMRCFFKCAVIMGKDFRGIFACLSTLCGGRGTAHAAGEKFSAMVVLREL